MTSSRIVGREAFQCPARQWKNRRGLNYEPCATAASFPPLALSQRERGHPDRVGVGEGNAGAPVDAGSQV
jgi:hypothetical protein